MAAEMRDIMKEKLKNWMDCDADNKADELLAAVGVSILDIYARIDELKGCEEEEEECCPPECCLRLCHYDGKEITLDDIENEMAFAKQIIDWCGVQMERLNGSAKQKK